MEHYRYNGQDDPAEVIEEHMMRPDHTVRLYVTNTRTKTSTLLCFHVTGAKGQKKVFGTTVAPKNASTHIEPGKTVTVNFDVTPVDIVVV